jgi:uncharacterized membrane protein YcaP (DUF421 family)
VDLLTEIFGTKNDISAAQECARAVLVFVYGFAAMRLMGRRILGKWSALDILLSVIVGSILGRAITGGAPLGGTIVASWALMCLHWIAGKAAARSDRCSKWLEGSPIVLGTHGRIDQSTRRSYSISNVDVLEALHEKGISSIEQADRIIVEPNGKITVFPKSRTG